MANPCDTVNEYGNLSESIVQSLFDVVSSAGALAEAVVVTLGMTLGTAGAVSDDIEQFAVSFVEEQGTLTEVYEQTGTFYNRLHDGGLLSDATVLAFSDTLAISGTLSDASDQAQPPGMLAEHGTLAGSIGPATTAMRTGDGGYLREALAGAKVSVVADSGTLADAFPSPFDVLAEHGHLADADVQPLQDVIGTSARLREAVSIALVQTISVSGTLADAVLQSAARSDEVAESATIHDTAISVSGTSDVLQDALVASDALSGHAQAQTLVAVSATVTDLAVSDIGGAWSCPTDSFAMSRWEHAPFESIAQIDGVLYVAGDQGLYRLEAEHDEAPIQARIRGGLTDFGAPQLKHASYYYAGYSGAVAVTVGYVPDGAEQSAAYALPARPAAEPTPGRAKLGRGMRSRYWRLIIENVDGADFTIYEQRLVIENASRRV